MFIGTLDPLENLTITMDYPTNILERHGIKLYYLF